MVEELSRYEKLVFGELSSSRADLRGIVPVGTHDWAARLHVDGKKIREALRSLEVRGMVEIEMRGSRICGARILKSHPEEKERADMGHIDKSIMSQPHGRGKLFSRRGDGSWEGTYQRPDGKTQRKRFRAENTMRAKEQYVSWCEEQDAFFEKEKRQKAEVKSQKIGLQEAPAPKRVPPENPVSETQGEEEKGRKAVEETKPTGTIYVITVASGVCISWTDSLEKAVAICDALAEAARASGFDAKYDVAEVKKWVL